MCLGRSGHSDNRQSRDWREQMHNMLSKFALQMGYLLRLL